MTILKATCLLLLPSIAALCADQGSITGKILTAAGAGAAVPKAPVKAKNLGTQAVYTAVSAADGTYQIQGLAGGAYEISVEYPPFFLPFHQGGIPVADGKATKLNIHLDDLTLNTLGDGGVEFAQLLADKPAPSGPTPRTGDGKPDLTGVWRQALPAPGGDPPEPLPWAEAVAKQRNADFGKDAPMSHCLPMGIWMEGFFLEYRIIQTPDLVVIIDGNGDPARQIYLDGRGHLKGFNPSFMGHSVGHWEGDTLVVETVGFNDRGWVPALGAFPQTEQLRVIERFHRADLGHLEVELTFEDPGAFKKPFKMKRVNSLAPKDWEILEYVCAENNRDVPHLVGK